MGVFRLNISTAKKVALLFAALLLACACALFVTPTRAFALYNQVSSDYPASRDLSDTASEGLAASGQSIYGGALAGSDIVSGTYVIPAYTSSRMCNLYATLGDATAKSNPNHATITVSGGVITASFYLSGAYTAVYFGSADQAAALAPEDGLTPSSSYIMDGSLDYDTGHGPFTVQLAALNTEFDFAVFSGGTKGVQDGLWYSRKGAFIATVDFAESCSLVADPAPKPDDGGDEPGGGGTGGGSSNVPDPDPDPEPAPPAPEEVAPEPEASEQPAETVEEYVAEEQQPELLEEEAPVVRGKLITIANAPDDSEGVSQAILQGATLSLTGFTTEQIALMMAGIVAVAGALVFAIRFGIQLRTPSELRKHS